MFSAWGLWIVSRRVRLHSTVYTPRAFLSSLHTSRSVPSSKACCRTSIGGYLNCTVCRLYVNHNIRTINIVSRSKIAYTIYSRHSESANQTLSVDSWGWTAVKDATWKCHFHIELHNTFASPFE